jgi:hypothetical protein
MDVAWQAFVTKKRSFALYKKSYITTNNRKMGCGMSAEDKERKIKNDEIENNLKKEKIALAKEIKMLLLGFFC